MPFFLSENLEDICNLPIFASTILLTYLILMEETIYLVSLCAFFAVDICLLIWIHYHLLVHREKSAWKRQQYRLQCGILTMIALVLGSYFWFYWNFKDAGPNNYFSLVGLFSAIIIGMCGQAVYSLADRRRLTFQITLSHLLVPVVLFVSYACFLDKPIVLECIESVAWLYYAAYVVIVFYACLRNSRRFTQRLEDSYVEIDKRQVMYRFRAILYCVSILFLFIAFLLEPTYLVHSIYFTISIFGWTYFTAVIIHLVDSPLANEMKEKTTVAETEKEPEPIPNEFGFDSPAMQRLSEQLDVVLTENKLFLDPDLDVDMLAQALCTNRTYVGRLFRMRGTTFSRYVNSLRLNHAELLLRTSNKSVGDICMECGFSDATFRRVFTERYNCTPVEYRRSARE